MAAAAKFPRDLPPEYYAAIGEIAARWNWLEFHLGVLAREGFGLGKKEARILTVGMAVKPKCHVVKIMAKKFIKDRALAERLRILASDIQDKIDDRNNYVHALYCSLRGRSQDLGRYVMGSGEQRFLPDFDPVPLSRIQGCAAELQALQDRMVEAVRALKALRGKSA